MSVKLTTIIPTTRSQEKNQTSRQEYYNIFFHSNDCRWISSTLYKVESNSEYSYHIHFNLDKDRDVIKKCGCKVFDIRLLLNELIEKSFPQIIWDAKESGINLKQSGNFIQIDYFNQKNLRCNAFRSDTTFKKYLKCLEKIGFIKILPKYIELNLTKFNEELEPPFDFENLMGGR